MRLDVYLVQNGFAASRQKAQWLLENGRVIVDGKPLSKPSSPVDEESRVEVTDGCEFVGRGWLKIDSFLRHVPFLINGYTCLDIGASTGGFTQYMLERGAKKVVTVDVGRAQLSDSLARDMRVEQYENCDIRTFSYHEQFDFVVVDLSFISTRELLTHIVSFSRAFFLILFKPQFEVGRFVKRTKKGVVVDENAVLHAMKHFECELARLEASILHKAPSHIQGKEGNQEYFYLCAVQQQ